MKRRRSAFAVGIAVVAGALGGLTAAGSTTAVASPSAPGAVGGQGEEDFIELFQEDVNVTAAEARARLDRQPDLQAIASTVRGRFSDVLSGAYIDHADAGRLHVRVTGKADEVRGLVNRHRNSQHVVVETSTKAPLNQLQRIYDEIVAGRQSVGAGWDMGVTLDSVNGVVLIDIPPGNDERRRSISARYPAGTVAFTDVPTTSYDDACSRPACDPPLRGGIQLNGPAGSATASFIVRSRTFPDRRYVLTSGHFATVVGDDISHPGGTNAGFIGDVLATANSGNVDAGRVGISGAGWSSDNGVYRTATSPNYPIYGWRVANDIIPGSYVYRSGISTGYIGGTVTNTFVSPQFGRNTNVLEWRGCGLAGDSGGPVITLDNIGRGLHDASSSTATTCQTGEVSYAIHLAFAQDALNVEVITN